MRLCRFDENRLGLVLGKEVADVSAALDVLPQVRWPIPYGDLLIANLEKVRQRVETLAPAAPRKRLDQVKLESPVANPSKIIAAPVNYMKHVEEARADAGINFGTDIKTIDHYGLFLKSNTSLIGPGDPVRLPALERRMDHEIELALIIGKEGYRIPETHAFDYVAGYAVSLDMVIRGTEDRSWRKSYDTFSVVGPWLTTPDEVQNPDSLDFRIKVNGETKQESNTKYLIFGIAKLISYASQAYRLYPGDIIMTGTPEGVAPVVPGDIMDCWIDQVGEMKVAVTLAT
jgi:2-keto-4-pentenoate hydratase/2-oxohepta-3-ene-1,7-dioic acid hydratase in catechol pathway